jgi:fluoride exporter
MAGSTLVRVAWVAGGGAIGSACRYLLDGWVLRATGPFFPWGTFVVNVVGCLVFGLIAGAVDERFMAAPAGRAFVLTGILGGFTTFSTFSFETMQLARDAQIARAMANLIGQVVFGVLAMWAGYSASRMII